MVALALGLGSVDMPVPSVADWEWLNWRFPRAVRAGDTIYARWTLTQKRPPVGGAAASIVVWRVDVHSADGALCAEGEIGAKVRRAAPARQHAGDGAPAGAGAAPRRRRRRSRANGTIPEPPAVAAPPAPEAKPERTVSGSRRRRRRRPSAGREEEHEPRAAHVQETASAADAVPPPPAVAPTSSRGTNKGIGGVLRRLRRT